MRSRGGKSKFSSSRKQIQSKHTWIDAFELWCWRRLLTVPWTARRSNQSILKEISSRCSLVGLMLKLKLEYFGHLMWRADSFEKTLMLGKIERRRRRGWQRMRWLDGIIDSMDMGLGGLGSWWWTGRPGMLWFMGLQRVGHDWATELNWKLELKKDKEILYNKLYQSLSLSLSHTHTHTHTHTHNTLSHNFTKYFHGVRKSTDKGDSPGGRIWAQQVSSCHPLAVPQGDQSPTGRPYCVEMLILPLSGGRTWALSAGRTWVDYATSLGLCFLIY